MVGPEVPLVAGLTDALAAAGVRAFGPSAKAAQLEGSKAFMKHILRWGSFEVVFIPSCMTHLHC